ncbi:MAG: hypothetical protein HC897_15380 [Thermoanaerobaculia bacterium]|nr:hypothetical protein [Thermoanaerobaculia bacterium]
MAAHDVTLRLPTPLFDHFRNLAARARRSLEAEILDVVATAASGAQDLPSDVARAVEELGLLRDEQLWRVAHHRLGEQEAAKLETLSAKQQERALTSREKKRLEQLVEQYDRAVLLRAEAARLLQARGHDISELLAA